MGERLNLRAPQLVPASNVRQFDCWQETRIDGLRFVATPAQHFSGRTLFDGNRTLWCSWVIADPPTHQESQEMHVFFSGDTGYREHFKEIVRRFGPFDVSMIEAGAYETLGQSYLRCAPVQ
jgi:L-ascorbate metabolism protein UlaG (beta-lactamase superfamily)